MEGDTVGVLSIEQTVARRDPRILTARVPMAIDLERIGDEADSMPQHVLRILPLRPVGIPQAGTPVQQEQGESNLSEAGGMNDQLPEASILQGILSLGREFRSMLQWTMKAFADRNAKADLTLCAHDTVVHQDT